MRTTPRVRKTGRESLVVPMDQGVNAPVPDAGTEVRREAAGREASAVLRTNQTYWEKLIDRIVFRNSTFGSENIRSAFLRALAQFVQADPTSNLTSSARLQRLCRRATTYQGARELSILNDCELDALMEAVVTET